MTRHQQHNQQVSFSTKSDYFDIKLYSDTCAWPDVTDFFKKFGVNIYVGQVDIWPLSDKMYGYDSSRDLISEMLDTTNSQVLHGTTQYPNRIYAPKQMYYQDYDHTPMVAMYYDQQYRLTKGGNKATGLTLKQNFTTCIMVLSEHAPPELDLQLITTDKQLYDWLVDIDPNNYLPLSYPWLEYIFVPVGDKLIPGLHFLERSSDIKRGARWPEWLDIDIELWRGRGRKVLAQHNVSHADFDIQPCDFDEHSVKSMFSNDVCAAIVCSRPELISRLTDALVWLSTDHNHRKVGQAASADGTVKIIYNTDTTHTVTIPPGMLV